MILRKAMKKVTDNNASPHEGIVGAILEVCNTDRQMIRNMVWDVVKADLNKLAENSGNLREEQLAYCRDHSLTLTPKFKEQLQHLTTTLESRYLFESLVL